MFGFREFDRVLRDELPQDGTRIAPPAARRRAPGGLLRHLHGCLRPQQP